MRLALLLSRLSSGSSSCHTERLPCLPLRYDPPSVRVPLAPAAQDVFRPSFQRPLWPRPPARLSMYGRGEPSFATCDGEMSSLVTSQKSGHPLLHLFWRKWLSNISFRTHRERLDHASFAPFRRNHDDWHTLGGIHA